MIRAMAIGFLVAAIIATLFADLSPEAHGTFLIAAVLSLAVIRRATDAEEADRG